jgi:hypothetical protein
MPEAKAKAIEVEVEGAEGDTHVLVVTYLPNFGVVMIGVKDSDARPIVLKAPDALKLSKALALAAGNALNVHG